MARRGRGATRLQRQSYGDPNRPTRASDYAGTGAYSKPFKEEFHPGRTPKGPATPAKALDDLIGATQRPAKPSFGSFRNAAKENPRKGQAFEVVHRGGKRYHKYASGRLVADEQAGSSKRIPKPQQQIGTAESASGGVPAGMPGAQVAAQSRALQARQAGQQVGSAQSAAIDQALARRRRTARP